MIQADNLKDVLNLPQSAEKKEQEETVRAEGSSQSPSTVRVDELGVSFGNLTELELEIIEAVLNNATPAQVARKVGLPVASVRAFLTRKEIREYLAELRDALNVHNQLVIQDTLGKMVAARIEEADGDFANLSQKDTLDIIKTFSDITNAIEKNKKDDKEQDVFIQIYNQIID